MTISREELIEEFVNVVFSCFSRLVFVCSGINVDICREVAHAKLIDFSKRQSGALAGRYPLKIETFRDIDALTFSLDFYCLDEKGRQLPPRSPQRAS